MPSAESQSFTGSPPKGWAKANLGAVVSLVSTKIHPSENPNAHYVGLEHIVSGESELHRCGRSSDVKSTKGTFFPGDILYGKLRPYLNKIAVPDFSGICSTDILVLRPEKGVESGFIEAVLRADRFIEFATKTSSGINLPRTSFEKIAPFDFWIAPSSEQRRIAVKLRGLLVRERNVRKHLEELPGLIKRYRAAILEAACAGRLVPTEAELARNEGRDFEPASVLLDHILVERRTKWEADQLAKMRASNKDPKDDKWKERYTQPLSAPHSSQREMPEGWVKATLDQLSWAAGYGTSVKCSYESDGPPVLRIPNIEQGRFKLADLKFARNSDAIAAEDPLQIGDFVLIRTNGSRNLVGVAALVTSTFDRPHYFASYLIRFRLLAEALEPAWVSTIWHAPPIREKVLQMAVSTAGQYNLSMGNLRELVMPLPPLIEQKRIVREVERRFSALDRIEKQVIDALEETAKLRPSLFHRATSGKLVKRDQRDEPASILLERIKTERATIGTEGKEKRMRKPKKSGPPDRRDAMAVLKQSSRALTPEELFQQCGRSDSDLDDVEDFYAEIRSLLNRRLIEESRTKNGQSIRLKAK